MSSLYFKTAGKGEPLILLHGFCENHLIWEQLEKDLAEHFTLYMPDLPGHGQSPLPDRITSLEDVACDILEWMDELGIAKATMMGHSMGGYVTLAAVGMQEARFNKFGLIHSTAMADSPEKKENRNKSIDFVREHGRESFFDIFIPGLYHKGGDWIPDVQRIVHGTPQDTVIRYTGMMRDRPERLDVLRAFSGEILFFGGKMDTFIPYASLIEQASESQKPQLTILEDVGHLGMYEDPGTTLAVFLEFLGSD